MAECFHIGWQTAHISGTDDNDLTPIVIRRTCLRCGRVYEYHRSDLILADALTKEDE